MFNLFHKTKEIKPTLAIDFDGVIHDYSSVIEAGRMGLPVRGAREAMIELKTQGYTLAIYSIKAETTYGTKRLLEWLEINEIPYDEVCVVRPAAAIYLDDRGLEFRNWKKALRDIDKRIELIKIRNTKHNKKLKK